MKETFYIKNSSMGSAFNPPLYPNHFHHVASYNMSICLSEIYYNEKRYSFIDKHIINQVKDKIGYWIDNKPSLNNKYVKDWIYQVLGYFNNCFVARNGSRNVQDLRCIKSKKYRNRYKTDKEFYSFLVKIQHLHAGIQYIKKFYPSYKATIEDFKNAYYGKEKLFTGKETKEVIEKDTSYKKALKIKG